MKLALTFSSLSQRREKVGHRQALSSSLASLCAGVLRRIGNCLHRACVFSHCATFWRAEMHFRASPAPLHVSRAERRLTEVGAAKWQQINKVPSPFLHQDTPPGNQNRALVLFTPSMLTVRRSSFSLASSNFLPPSRVVVPCCELTASLIS